MTPICYKIQCREHVVLTIYQELHLEHLNWQTAQDLRANGKGWILFKEEYIVLVVLEICLKSIRGNVSLKKFLSYFKTWIFKVWKFIVTQVFCNWPCRSRTGVFLVKKKSLVFCKTICWGMTFLWSIQVKNSISLSKLL